MKNEKASSPAVVEEKQEAIAPEKPAKRWQTPVLEDVSGEIMAQPYIRFT